MSGKQKQASIPVLLSITGGSTGEYGPEDVVHLVTTGLLQPLSNGYRLDYQEAQEDPAETQHISLLVEGPRLTVSRDGAYSTAMVFQKGQRFEGAYRTPMGDMDMAVYATHVRCRMGPDSGDIHLQYQLDLQGQFVGMHELRLKYAANDGVAPS